MKKLIIKSLLFIIILFITSYNLLTEAYFELPYSIIDYKMWCYYSGDFKIDGVNAQTGDEVAFFDPQGVLCGFYVVKYPGRYGSLPVYGDDPDTLKYDEGAIEGDILSIKVWDASAGQVYEAESLFLIKGSAIGEYIPSEIPPLWRNGSRYTLDISIINDPNNNEKRFVIELSGRNGCFFESTSDDFKVSIKTR